MRHISIFRNDLESFNGLGISYYIIEEDWPILLNPGKMSVYDLVFESNISHTMEAHSS